MKLLRSHDLPKKLTAFRSLEFDITAALDCRTALLARAKGYPRPAHVVARIQNLIPLNAGIMEIKNGIKKLRDIAQYAAEILMTIPQLKVEKQLLKTQDVQDYINNNKDDYGFKHLDENDIVLATYMILSSEMLEASWTLDQPSTNTTNRITQFHELYQSLLKNRVSGVTIKPGTPGALLKDRLDIAYAGAQPYVYRSDTNTLEPLFDVAAVSRSLKSIMNDTADGDKATVLTSALQREDTILRIADLRLLDHIFSLFMTPDIWNSFVPHRPRSDAGNNEERAKGLKLFAGYLHSLLMMPYFYRIELWRKGYDKMEKWLGSLPFIPQDVSDNYTKIVMKYDTLNVARDVDALYELNQNMADKPTGSDIHVFFSEFAHLFGIDEAKRAAEAAVVLDPQIKITELAMLKDNKYNYILLSHPLGKYEMIRDIQKSILETEMYRTTMKDAFNSIIPGVSKYLQDDTVEKIKAAAFAVPFAFHQSLPITPSYATTSGTKLEGNTFTHRHYAMSYDYDTERALTKEMLYTVTNSRNLVTKFPVKTVFDRHVAKELRNWLGREWRALYPSSLLMGDRVLEPKTLRNSPIDMEQLVEYVTGYHFELVKHSLASTYTREIWATVFSSFGILYTIDKKSPPIKTGSPEIPRGEEAGTGFPLSLVTGFGMPYGKTYEQLARMQDFKDGEVVQLTPEVYIGFLKKVPLPSHKLNISSFSLNRQYYYCSGNGDTMDVKRLCFDEGLLHMAMRPISNPPVAEHVFFDSIYAYLNDSLLLQEDIAMRLVNQSEAQFSYALPFTPAEWKLEKLVPMIEFAELPKYANVTGGGVITEEKKAESITKLVKEMESAVKTADAGSVVKTEASTQTALPVNINASKNVGGGGKKKKDLTKTEEKADGAAASD